MTTSIDVFRYAIILPYSIVTFMEYVDRIGIDIQSFAIIGKVRYRNVIADLVIRDIHQNTARRFFTKMNFQGSLGIILDNHTQSEGISFLINTDNMTCQKSIYENEAWLSSEP